MSSLPPPTLAPPPSSGTYTCPYCRLESNTAASSCPHCGAPVDIRARVSESGWEKQPSIKDMARIQFGQSTCQVTGLFVPAAELRLAAGEGVYFSHHTLLWADTQVRIVNQPLKGAWNRQMAGMDLVMLQADGPGTLALADNTPGETIAVPIMPGRPVDVREHRFLTASLNVVYDWYQSGVWYTTSDGDESETHYPAGVYLDRFAALQTPGLLLLHGHGNVFVRDLAPGEPILVHPGAFVWKDASVALSLHLERAASGGWFMRWQPATPWLRLTGPGRIAVSSKYERMEQTGRITNTSWCTAVDWNFQRPAMASAGVIQAMQAVTPFQDGPFEAALDAFATQHGFVPGRDAVNGPQYVHEYTHPSGLRIVCRVTDAAGASAAAAAFVAQLAGGLGQPGAGSMGNLLTGLANRAGAHGQPVDGFGFPAVWTQGGPGASQLSVNKGGRVLLVAVESQMSPQDQFGWLRAFALAALPVM